MNRIATLVFLSTLAGAMPAAAQSGMGLYWDGCSADPNSDVKTFACDTNSGAPFLLYVTVAAPAAVPRLVAALVQVDLWFSYHAPVPPWWLTGPGQCRQNAVSMSFDPAVIATPGCADLWAGTPTVSAFQAQVVGTSILRLSGAAAVPAGQEIHLPADGVERIVGRIAILRSKTTGPGACAGCDACAQVRPLQVKLQQPAGLGEWTITNPLPQAPYEVFWNGWCPPPDPVQNRSWGAIKGMYR